MTMILLDTNVISEPTHAQPDAAVVAWLNGQRLSTLYLSTITLAEMRFGIAQLPEGRKKNGFCCYIRRKFGEKRRFGNHIAICMPTVPITRYAI